MNHSFLNKLRAAVLGANDGIISVATALIALVTIFTQSQLLLTAISVTVAGAFSMAAGEYVSVASQRDVEKKHFSENLTNPMHAAISSFFAFIAGALIPATVAVLSESIVLICVSVVVSLAITSLLASRGTGNSKNAVIRMVIVGSVSLTAGILANQLFSNI